MAIEVGPGATAVATTQAAEKIYRAAKGGGPCAIDVAVRVGEGAILDWLPQETIVFEGARLKRRTDGRCRAGRRVAGLRDGGAGPRRLGRALRLGPAARLLVGAPRRTAGSGPTRSRVEGETPTGAGFGAANALATVIGVWDEPQPRFEKARALLEVQANVRAGVTLVNGVMVARLLGEATAVRGAAIRFLDRFSRAAACRAFGMFDAACGAL